jgi:hypothetical protein
MEKIMSGSTLWVWVLVACLCMPGLARAQSAAATLSGVVVDETGAVVPDVSVTVLNRATGWQRVETTSREGAFTVPLLPAGRYVVRAQRDGFTPLEVRDVALNVNDEIVLRLQLKVAEVGESVTVVAEPSRLRTSPAVATVIDRQFVENLPLNGRTFQALLELTPGVVITGVIGSFTSPGQFSVNGQRTAANYFTVDGVSANVATTTSSALGQTGGGASVATASTGGTQNLVSRTKDCGCASRRSSFRSFPRLRSAKRPPRMYGPTWMLIPSRMVETSGLDERRSRPAMLIAPR